MIGLLFARSIITAMKHLPSKLTQLPPTLRKAVVNRLTQPGFTGYGRLARWLRDNGREIAAATLRRYREGLAPESNSFGPARVQKQKAVVRTTSQGRKTLKPVHSIGRPKSRIHQARPAGAGVTTEGLMRLTQEKLCSALADIGKLQQGDMSRLAHAVAHLTQAAVSFQRWTAELKQRAGEPAGKEPVARSVLRKGLSPETSEALRHALLGVTPLDPQESATRPTNLPDDGAASLTEPAITSEAVHGHDNREEH